MDLSDEGRERTVAVTGGLLPSSLRVPAGDLSLACLLWGRADDPTVVALHGNGAHAHWWDAVVPALVPGWRVVAPHLRGHGPSDRADPPAYTVADFASDLTAVLGALAPGPVVLVGHSMGGRVALWYASEHPERVRALALLDSRLTPVRRDEAMAWRGSVAGRREGRTYPTRAAAIAAFRFVPDEPDVPSDVIANVAHHAVVERAPGEWTYRFDRAVLDPAGDGAGDLGARLRRIRCPLLVVAGAASPVFLTDDVTAARTNPRCAVEVLPGGHHFLLAHAAAAGAVLRAFLDRLPGLPGAAARR